VGNYRVDSLLGVGGMGKVYAATAGDGTRVALKIVKDDYARDETFMARFSLEARIARDIRNPHVVRVLESGEHDGCSFLALEFIEGISLEQKLRREGRLDVPSTIKICTQVADGLDALWEAKMVHRDVKPGNILLDTSGNAYLTDFGLAKDTEGALLTQPGHTLGTLDYMAPEQLRAEEVGPGADVYALGCVVFECLQGRPPFGDRQGMRLLWAHLQEEPPDLSAAGPAVTAELTRAVKTALVKDPGGRPRSAGEYARLLARAVRDG
jgi:serine/threonine protein kinase